MKTYVVNFYFGTDLRTHKEVEAHNEVNALAIALTAIREESWVNSYGMKIVIILKD